MIKKARALPWMLLLPSLVIIFALTVYPLVDTFVLSFKEFNLYTMNSDKIEWVGLKHYIDFIKEPYFLQVTLNTLIFGLSCVFGTIIFGLAVGLLLNQSFRGKWILGIGILIPWAFPKVAAGIVWRWLFNDQYGFVNYALTQLGLSQFDGFAWFNDKWIAFFVIFLMVVWQSFPFVSISILAGLQSIPKTVYEASFIDGANAWQRFSKITLPLLAPILTFMFVIESIWEFKIFEQIYVMTNGGPAGSTNTLAFYAWSEAFTALDFSRGSAISILLFILVMVFTLFYMRLDKDGGQNSVK